MWAFKRDLLENIPCVKRDLLEDTHTHTHTHTHTDGVLTRNCLVNDKRRIAARFIPVATAAVVQGIWCDEVLSSELSQTLITLRQVLICHSI
jgi:hypothetical protein